jgi:hypothetical protein
MMRQIQKFSVLVQDENGKSVAGERLRSEMTIHTFVVRKIRVEIAICGISEVTSQYFC